MNTHRADWGFSESIATVSGLLQAASSNRVVASPWFNGDFSGSRGGRMRRQRWINGLLVSAMAIGTITILGCDKGNGSSGTGTGTTSGSGAGSSSGVGSGGSGTSTTGTGTTGSGMSSSGSSTSGSGATSTGTGTTATTNP